MGVLESNVVEVVAAGEVLDSGADSYGGLGLHGDHDSTGCHEECDPGGNDNRGQDDQGGYNCNTKSGVAEVEICRDSHEEDVWDSCSEDTAAGLCWRSWRGLT